MKKKLDMFPVLGWIWSRNRIRIKIKRIRNPAVKTKEFWHYSLFSKVEFHAPLVWMQYFL